MEVRSFLTGKKDEIVAKAAALADEASSYDQATAQLDIDLKAARDAGFDEGIAQAGIPAGDKIYTEADLQRDRAEQRALVQGQLDSMQVDIDRLTSLSSSLQAQVDAFPATQAAALKAQAMQIATEIKDASIDDLAIAAKLEAQ